jgi:hypothetical protein
MTMTTDRTPVTTTVTPVREGDREVGAWVVGPDGATYHPVVDLTRLTGTVLATAAAVTIATAAVVAAIRQRPAIGAVTMGPGGWVSVKGAPKPPLRATGRRPWWARLLRAEPLAGCGRRSARAVRR